MQKGILLCFIFFSLVRMVVFATGEGESLDGDNEEHIVLRLAETHSKDYPTTQGDYKFAELVYERTNGRITIEVFHSKQLGQEKAVIELVQFGAIDFARVSIAPVADFYKPLNVLQLPYLYKNPKHMWLVLNSEIGDEILKGIEDSDFIGFCWYESGARNFYTTTLVNKPGDLAGLNIRVMESNLFIELIKLFDAHPIPIPFGEVYSAIQTGVVDSAENNWSSYYTTGHYKIAKYYIIDEHTRVPEILIGSKITLAQLSAEDLAIIRQSAKDSVLYQRQKWAEFEEEAIIAVKANGNIITEIDDNSEWQAKVQPMYDKLDAEMQEIVERIRAMQ